VLPVECYRNRYINRFLQDRSNHGDILLGMRYNYFGKGSVNNDNEKGLFISRERRRE
jgi:hypothetical protein